MATTKIEIVGKDEYGLICEMYNQIARPPVDVAFLDRRLHYRHNALIMVAHLDNKPVGFSCGYELRPSTYYSWLYGVLPDARRLGVASQLMAAEHAWARQKGYEMARFECYNQHRPMLLLAIHTGYDIVGIRYDSHTGNNLVVFEKHLQDTPQ
ncbi:MAG TPA: GNAT family N-acetyltransferase [Phycisphaerae bacterium]|nr:GNAT family N-acetyltransferase [Phycisphaerae bacterium]